MTEDDRAARGKAAFIAELRNLHEQCGKPYYKKLAAISEHLPQLYPPPQGVECRYLTLSVSAISEILAGKRKGLPSFDWVASFVLCCQRWAFEVNAATADPGVSTLPEWARRRAAHSRSDDAGAGHDGPPPSGGGPPPGTQAGVRFRADAGSRPDDGTLPACAVRLPPRQQAYVKGYGSYGQTLVERAQAGHPDAVYMVALLLGTDPAYREATPGLLLHAAAAGHAPSIDLLDENPGGLACFEAARMALALARMADADGSRDAALAFYQAAARGGAAGVPAEVSGGPACAFPLRLAGGAEPI
jgi:hypothetical protein